MNDVLRDAYDYQVEEIPELNTKKLLDCWDWVSMRQGRDGEPAWFQGDYVRSMYTPERYKTMHNAAAAEVETGYCGTACCIAGYVALEATEIIGKSTTSDGQRYGGLPTLPLTFEIDGEAYNMSQQNSWHEAGQKILGLTPAEAQVLFSGQNTREQIRAIMNKILAHRGEPITI